LRGGPGRGDLKKRLVEVFIEDRYAMGPLRHLHRRLYDRRPIGHPVHVVE